MNSTRIKYLKIFINHYNQCFKINVRIFIFMECGIFWADSLNTSLHDSIMQHIVNKWGYFENIRINIHLKGWVWLLLA
jgi:uncharacterized membrane protein